MQVEILDDSRRFDHGVLAIDEHRKPASGAEASDGFEVFRVLRIKREKFERNGALVKSDCCLPVESREGMAVYSYH